MRAAPPASRFSGLNRRRALAAALAIPVLALGLAWLSGGFTGAAGWPSFLAVLALGGLILWGGWRLLAGETPPGWLAVLLLAAALLRLGLGALWTVALPAWGYATPVEQAGYVFQDAFERDQAAWELAGSGQPLAQAFRRYQAADQYGGLLFLSAALYRGLGGETHQPLLIVVLGAACSSLAVPLGWAFTRRLWGAPAAAWAAWGLALYPEAMLLGSAQMREAFAIPLAAAGLYGLVRYQQERSRAGLAWMLAAPLIGLPLSPPFSGLMLVLLAWLAVTTGDAGLFRRRGFWLALAGLALLAAAGLWLSWGQIAPPGVSNPLELGGWWLRKAADYQAFLSRQASGWVQKIFRSTPAGLHLPLLVAYGIVQPFLPAALLAGGAPIWQAIAVWRALGWTILLLLLLYAAWRAVFSSPRSRWALAAGLAAWAVMIVASLRSGGDQWDNPRYRAMTAGLQIALAAWAWSEQRRAADPWLRRAVVGAGLCLAWFLPWYLRRYAEFTWPVVDLFKTVGLGLASAFLYSLWDWARTAGRAKAGYNSQAEF